jgi:DNA invertase Pin-like site-specific DNA recombinase
MKYGYARVSTNKQELNLQIDALKKAGCKQIFKEIAKGSKTDRLQLNKLLSLVKPGDAIVVWKLDRIGRSLKHLITLINELIANKVSIISLNDPINTITAQGRLIFNIFASLAEFEKDLIRERTMAGLSSARARGRMGGRPKGISKQAEEKTYAAEALYKQGKLSCDQIAKQIGISKTTLYKYLRLRHVKIGVIEQ